MEIDQGWIVALITGIAIPLLGLKLAPGTLGRLLFASQERENTALAALMDIAKSSVDGMVKMSSSMQQIATNQSGHGRDSDLRWQMERDMLIEIVGTVGEIKDSQKVLIGILAERDNGAG